MIYTVTFNPSVDYIMTAETVAKSNVNRSTSEKISVGGKGINVSLMLETLGIKSVALGFISGFTGEYINDQLKDKGINTDFINLDNGFTRINVKLKSENITEINGKGPDIPQNMLQNLYGKLDKLISGDTLILAGSIPPSLPENIYEQILSRLYGRNIRFIVDATGKLLINVLKYKPFLIKPNHYELGEIFNKELSNTDDIIFYAKKLKEMGAVNVLISMSEKGSVLVDENSNVHIQKSAQGRLVNSVGSGDSMVAGFTAGYLKTNDYNYALKLGTACGGATAFSDFLGNKENIDKILNTL